MTVSYLFNRASGAFHSLKRLALSGSRIGSESIKSITTALAKSSSSGCTLSELNLSDNPIEVSGLQALGNVVREGILSRLRYLNLSGSLTSDVNTNASWLTTFVEALYAHCPHLRYLDLSQNNLGVPGATALARGVSRLQQYHSTVNGKLPLDRTNLGDEGLCAFVDSLEGICHFEYLCLNENGIHATGVSCLADAVCSGKIVIINELHLSNNALGLEGALAVGRMLSNNHCQLDWLYLSECELTTAGGGLPNTDPLNLDSNISSETVRQQLCQMPQNNTVTKLILNGNKFTGNDIHILAGFMCLCLGLVNLYTSNCGITSDDLIQLIEILKSSIPSKPLRSWELDDNKINDDELSTLIEHLPSLFPKPCVFRFRNNNIIVSREMKGRLKEALDRRSEEVRCCQLLCIHGKEC